MSVGKRRWHSLHTWLAQADGFNLVILTVAVTLLNVGIAMALPLWSQVNQREKEEELIFRGLQYAEAIRVFQQRNGRLPTRLEELLEVKPRSIRQLWANPMLDDGRWALILEGRRGGPPGNNRPEDEESGIDTQQGDQNQQGTATFTPGGDVLTSGNADERTPGAPIKGVYSPEGGSAVKNWFGSSEMSEWHFTVERLQSQQQVGGLAAQSLPKNRPVNAGRIGRPFPPELQVQNVMPQQVPPGATQGQDLNGRPRPPGPGGAAAEAIRRAQEKEAAAAGGTGGETKSPSGSNRGDG